MLTTLLVISFVVVEVVGARRFWWEFVIVNKNIFKNNLWYTIIIPDGIKFYKTVYIYCKMEINS